MSSRGVRVDMNEEMKFLRKFKNKIGGSGRGMGVRLGGGVRMDVKEKMKFLRKFTLKNGGGGCSGWGMFGLGGGQGGCKRRI